jgi:N-methylhydantoinase B
VERDLALGYVSAEAARADYGLSEERVADVLAASRRGELPR